MSHLYAYRVENNQVTDGIIVDGVNTNAQWASDNIGGFWVDSDVPAWIGGTWDETDGFRPVQPSSDCWWENDQWVCPEVKEVTQPTIEE